MLGHLTGLRSSVPFALIRCLCRNVYWQIGVYWPFMFRAQTPIFVCLTAFVCAQASLMTDQFSGVIFFEAYDFYNTAEYTNLVSGRTPKKMNAGTPDGFTVICPICVDTLCVQKCFWQIGVRTKRKTA